MCSLCCGSRSDTSVPPGSSPIELAILTPGLPGGESPVLPQPRPIPESCSVLPAIAAEFSTIKHGAAEAQPPKTAGLSENDGLSFKTPKALVKGLLLTFRPLERLI